MTTRREVEKAARALGDDRWNAWMKCGVHDWHVLPLTDAGEPYCPQCYAIWTPDGAIHNVPEQPTALSSRVHTGVRTPQAVIEALARAPDIVVPLVREMPLALLKRRPSTGRWSVHEHACHLAVVHRLFFDRLDQMLATPAAVITPYDPGQDDPEDRLLALDLDDMLNRYVADRHALVARLHHLGLDDWQRTAEHGEYSHYSVFIMFRHLALHDFFHAYRIEELLLRKEWAADWRSASAR